MNGASMIIREIYASTIRTTLKSASKALAVLLDPDPIVQFKLFLRERHDQSTTTQCAAIAGDRAAAGLAVDQF